ncbi:MAG: homoserine O-succinyltransferase [Lachnospiraceae bacterium]|nr:homoserine O-succinyltransferase [Lachnospiraceae bacterium]
MPINVHSELPAKKIMEEENIFMMDELRAGSQDIRPLKIAILNLMPLKEETEVHLLRCLSNTPLQVEVSFISTASYIGSNTSKNHLDQFYLTYEDIKDNKYDGFIITGAPVENMKWEDVIYWDEVTKIMEWSKTHVTSTLHICWGAQAGIYYHYGIDKHELNRKISGIYSHMVHNRKEPILRGFDDVFLAPHSRYTEIKVEEVKANPELTVLAESEEAGLFLVMAGKGKQFFVFGHPEYDRLTLDKEYRRDLAKGINPEIPHNYYINDNPDIKPLLTWRSHSNALYTNWLNYYVYQNTPYEWK